MNLLPLNAHRALGRSCISHASKAVGDTVENAALPSLGHELPHSFSAGCFLQSCSYMMLKSMPITILCATLS
ncbi:hypothetical protein IF2G_02189 [Cordyceps javanica]|nr:hypothetical protein IF2G_02189 [Cordyceps javanica]